MHHCHCYCISNCIDFLFLIDILAENNTLESQGFGGVEVRKTTLCGADDERKRKKAELLGHSIDSSIGGKKFGGAVGFGVCPQIRNG